MSMLPSHVLGREIYNRLDLVWHLLVDCQRGKENFYLRPPLSPPKRLKGIAALKIGVLAKVWKKLLISVP